MFTTVNPSGANPDVGYVPGQWPLAPVEILATMALQHRQLVEAVHNTDGVSTEQAELQVTEFEQYFQYDA